MPGIDQYTKLMLHMNSSFEDFSSSNHTVTANGNAQIDTSQSVFGGGSGLFDGASDYLSIPASNDFNHDDFENFTLDFRLRLNSFPSNNTSFTFFDQTLAVSPGNYQSFELVNISGSYYFRYVTGSAFGSTASTLVSSTWYHVAFVKSGLTLKIFLDGTQVGSDLTLSGSELNNFTQSVNIGKNNGGSWLNGWIDEYRWSNIARWTSNFTPPTEEYSVDTVANSISPGSGVRLELRDRSFNLLEILDAENLDLSWSYSRIGGCGEFSFRLPRKLFQEKAISGDYNVRIFFRNPGTKSFDLWYQGLVENKIPHLRGNSEDIEVTGHGFQCQLSRIYLDGVSYSSQEASLIVKDILDNYIVPATDIEYDSSDIEVTSFTLDRIDFNTDALNAMQTIAEIVGSREWGVDKNRNFFFKAKSSTVGFRYVLGKNITSYSEDQDFKEIINKVIVQGAQAGGTYYKATYNDTISQLKYGIRTKVIQNSSINSSVVSEQLADAIFLEFNEVVRKVNLDLVGINAQLESTIPVPLFNIIAQQKKYGQDKYGRFLYGGLINRSLNRINYTLTNNGTLQVNVDLGQIRPSLSEEIGQLNYKLEQQRNAAL